MTKQAKLVAPDGTTVAESVDVMLTPPTGSFLLAPPMSFIWMTADPHKLVFADGSWFTFLATGTPKSGNMRFKILNTSSPPEA